MAGALQFGEPRPGLSYPDRPAAFGVVERDGRIALVRVEVAGVTPWLDLPGGALDPGETEAQALVREFGEETGLLVTAGARFAEASQYFLRTDGRPFNNRCGFWSAAMAGEAPARKIEDDHTLVWMDAPAAIANLRHDAHAWAVAAWLRCVARKPATG